MTQQEEKWPEVTNERWVVWPAAVERNFDANGSPCSTAADYAIPELLREVTLVQPVDFININFKVDFTGKER